MNTCHNNPKTLWATKTNKQTASGYSLFTNFSLDTTKNKLIYYRRKDYMENFCINFRELAPKTINYKKINDTINN